MGCPGVDAGQRNAEAGCLGSSSETRELMERGKTIFAMNNRWWAARRTAVCRGMMIGPCCVNTGAGDYTTEGDYTNENTLV